MILNPKQHVPYKRAMINESILNWFFPIFTQYNPLAFPTSYQQFYTGNTLFFLCLEEYQRTIFCVIIKCVTFGLRILTLQRGGI